MDDFQISILEYLGKVEDGILVLLSVTYQKQYYEATFFYNHQDILLTISEELESLIGDIKQHKLYPDILRDILKKIVPFQEINERLDKVDFSRWVQPIIELESSFQPEKINPQQIQQIDQIKKDTE
jgi:hypothetical protein